MHVGVLAGGAGGARTCCYFEDFVYVVIITVVEILTRSALAIPFTVHPRAKLGGYVLTIWYI